MQDWSGQRPLLARSAGASMSAIALLLEGNARYPKCSAIAAVNDLTVKFAGSRYVSFDKRDPHRHHGSRAWQRGGERGIGGRLHHSAVGFEGNNRSARPVWVIYIT